MNLKINEDLVKKLIPRFTDELEHAIALVVMRKDTGMPAINEVLGEESWKENVEHFPQMLEALIGEAIEKGELK